MKTTADLRRIAGEVCGLFPGEAGELVAFAGLLEDLDAAKKRKLEMIANMPPSRAQMLQNTIAFHEGRANGAEARVEKLEAGMKLALEALGQAVDAITTAIGPPPHEGKVHGPNNEPCAE